MGVCIKLATRSLRENKGRTLITLMGISVRWFNVMLLPLVFLERIIAEDCNALIVLLRIVLLES